MYHFNYSLIYDNFTPFADSFFAFSATFHQHDGQAVNYYEESIRFSNVTVNEGSTYDAKVGSFTAPLPGFYYLHTSVVTSQRTRYVSGPGDDCQTMFRKNRKVIPWLSASAECDNFDVVDDNCYVTNAVTSVMRLEKNDVIDVIIVGEKCAPSSNSIFQGYYLHA